MVPATLIPTAIMVADKDFVGALRSMSAELCLRQLESLRAVMDEVDVLLVQRQEAAAAAEAMPAAGDRHTAKEQIERDEGTELRSQLLCRVQNSSDGSSVRGFDQQDPAVCEKAPAAIQSVPATCGAAL